MRWILSFSGLRNAIFPRLAGFVHTSAAPAPDLHRSERAVSQPDQPGLGAASPGVACLEVLVLGALVPAALLWFSPAASLSLVLSALVLSPLLLGLHYGFVAGTSSAALIAGALAGLVHLKPGLLAEFPKGLAIGLLLVGMFTGEARDRWAARLRRLSRLNDYHQTRLHQFTGAYQLLQVSHAQLERRLAGGASSLRTALQRLQLQAPPLDGACTAPLGGIAPWLLDIMVEAGHLHAGAVYALSERGALQLPAVATVGKEASLSLFNPLLREALRTGMLTSVQPGHEAVHEQVIAVVPLVDASGRIHGVVSINDMAFAQVHQDTFELLGLLGRHIGDILARRARTIAPGQACGLRESLERHLGDVRRHALPAALIACRIVSVTQREACVASCCHGSRGLDQSWIALNRKGQPVVLLLLPLTDEAGVKSYLARLENGQGGASLRIRGIVPHFWMLGKERSADELLAEVGAACDIEALHGLGAPAQKPATLPARVAL